MLPRKKLNPSTMTALAVAAIVPPLGYSVESIISGAPQGIVVAIGFIPIFYGYSLAAALVLAMPLGLIIYYLNLARWWTAVLGGLLIGTSVPFITNRGMTTALLLYGHLPIITEVILVPAALGALSGAVFWVLWKRNAGPPLVDNPDTASKSGLSQ